MLTTLQLFIVQSIITGLMAIKLNKTSLPYFILCLIIDILIPILGVEYHLLYAAMALIGIILIAIFQSIPDNDPNQDIPWDSYF